MSRRALVIVSLLLCDGMMAQPIDCAAERLTMRHLERLGIAGGLHEALPAASSLRTGGIVVLPVAVHVVWNIPAENVPDVAILAVIDQLNLDYSAQNPDLVNVRAVFQPVQGDAQIAFCLAHVDPFGNATNGITRTMTSETWFDPDTEADDMKSAPTGTDAWDPAHYLNIWVCDISSGGGNTAGYAYLPIGGIPGSSVDGVVLDYDLGIGVTSRTATHEVGHYLGLLHPWGVNGGCADDDGLSDTPLTSGPTLSCFDTTFQTCGFLVQYENFMDQSPCRIMFTSEQTVHMAGILDSVRISLIESLACSGAGTLEPQAQGCSFLLQDGAVVITPLGSRAFDVLLFDAGGRELLRSSQVQAPYCLPLGGLPSGAYFIRVDGIGMEVAWRLVLTDGR